MTTFSGLFGGAAGAGQVSVPHVGYVSGMYYRVAATRIGATISSAATVSGTTYYVPMYIHSDVSISALIFRHNSAADTGKKVRMGIYSNSGGMPGTLLASTAEAIMPGSAGYREMSVSYSLAKGWYFVAFISDGLASFAKMLNSDLYDANWSMQGTAAATDSATLNTTVTGTYGALPSTALTPTTNNDIPIVSIKVA